MTVLPQNRFRVPRPKLISPKRNKSDTRCFFPIERPLPSGQPDCVLQTGRGSHGSVLLEVVLALALFLAAATVIMAGLHSSVEAAERLRLQTHAINLAISVMSEMQMHLRPIASIGPEPFAPPFEKWKYQVIVSQSQSGPIEPDALQTVEVVIRHSEESAVQRLSRDFRTSDIAASATNSLNAGMEMTEF